VPGVKHTPSVRAVRGTALARQESHPVSQKRLFERSLPLLESVEDHSLLSAEVFEDLLQPPKHGLGLCCIASLLGQPLDTGHLPGHEQIDLDEVLLKLGDFLILLEHGGTIGSHVAPINDQIVRVFPKRPRIARKPIMEQEAIPPALTDNVLQRRSPVCHAFSSTSMMARLSRPSV